jgi:hypothetical protein
MKDLLDLKRRNWADAKKQASAEKPYGKGEAEILFSF